VPGVAEQQPGYGLRMTEQPPQMPQPPPEPETEPAEEMARRLVDDVRSLEERN
jgi:hypothetical protein